MNAIVKQKPKLYKDWPKGLDRVDKPVPTVRASDDVQIKVIAGGICGTDVGIYQSKDSLKTNMSTLKSPNVTIGHEFCGRVVDAGPRARLRLAELVRNKAKEYPAVRKYVRGRSAASLAGARDFLPFVGDQFIATAEMHVTCGTCAQCRLGEYHVCTNTVIRGLHGDGAFAEYVVLPAGNVLLFKRGEIPEEIIAFMDAIGNATHTVQSLSGIAGKSVAILGAGVIGLMSVAIARGAGARKVFVTDASHGENTHEKLDERRFSMARLLGATDCFDVSIPEEKKRFYALAGKENHGAGVDAVLEMSGSYYAYEDAFHVLRMGGELSLLGLPSGSMPLDFARHVIFSGRTIHGVIGRRVWSTWEMMTSILKKGLAKRFVTSGFVTHQFPLTRFEEGFHAIATGDALKVLLRP